MYPFDNNELVKQMLAQTNQQTETHTPKVNGRAGAEMFQLPPNSDVLALDQNEDIVWSIQTDSAGYKTCIPWDISKHKEVKQQDVIKSLEERITKLEEALRNGKPNLPANGSKQHMDAGNRSNAQRRDSTTVSAELSKN